MSTSSQPCSEAVNDRVAELYDLYGTDEIYYTPPTTAPRPREEEQQHLVSNRGYQPQTLKANNRARQSILPRFPPRSSARQSDQYVDLLLCNVPKQLLSYEQYECRRSNWYITEFELQERNGQGHRRLGDSYLLTLFNELYRKLGSDWHIDIALLDCNLARLRQLEVKHAFHFSLTDLPVALEFYLQMDVDVFHLKTCSFRQAQRRRLVDESGQSYDEGIFASDQQSIEGRYSFSPCHQRNCLYCRQPMLSIPYGPKRIHRFVNQYQAILNCPATCTTRNIIYALTCPCGQKDFVAFTNRSFVDRLTSHRHEIMRVIYEFLVGEANAKDINGKSKSEEMIANDAHWLYQHATRCPAILQSFLDRNPAYWCFVPMPKDVAARTRPSTRPMVSGHASPARRTDAQAAILAENVPLPDNAEYTFTFEQVDEQKAYFKYGKERQPLNMHQTNFYNATMVAVLPEHCSESVNKFVEALFITHAECALNNNGHLVNPPTPPTSHDQRGAWHRGLIRGPYTSILF